LVISKVLWVYDSTARVVRHSDGWFFDDTNRIAKVLNFASVISIRDVFCNRSATKELENLLAENFRCKVTGRQVVVT
jgi:hypothetical protein